MAMQCTTLEFDHLTSDNSDMFQTLHHLLVLNAITDTPSVGNTGVRVCPGSRGTTRAQLTFKHQYINTFNRNGERKGGYIQNC